MAKISSLKLISICVLIVIFFSSIIGFLIYKINKNEELLLKQKYETLNTVDISKIETMSPGELKNLSHLIDDYSEELRRNKENDEFIKSLVPRFGEIRRAFSKYVSKRDMAKKKEYKKKRKIEEYRQHLREEEGISDESIINQKVEEFIKEYDLLEKENDLSQKENKGDVLVPVKDDFSIKDFIKRKEAFKKQREASKKQRELDEEQMNKILKRVEDGQRQLFEKQREKMFYKEGKE